MSSTLQDAPKVKAVAPWFGSKRTLAPEIVRELGNHRAYWEPFCGSMAVLLAKPKCSMETVNDLHGDLINLIRVIQHPWEGPRLYRKLRRAVLSRELQEESWERVQIYEFEPGINRAYHYFVASWFGRNGVSGTSNVNSGFCVSYTKNGGHAAKRFESAVNSIPAWRRRMRNVTVLCDDAFQILERIEDADGVAIYVDPPYVKKSARYVHDFDAEDHARLAELLGKFNKTRVVVSYYDCEKVRELYGNRWTLRPLKATKSLGRNGKGGSRHAPEILLINGRSVTGQLF